MNRTTPGRGAALALLSCLAAACSGDAGPRDAAVADTGPADGSTPGAERSTPDARPPVDAVGPHVAPGTSWVLKVLSYNIHGLPVLADDGQYQAIGEVLADRRQAGDEPDLVLLQESFIPEADVIQQLAGYPHITRGPARQLKLLDSGLVVMSNHPIRATRRASYDECEAEDCVSNKGLVAVEIQPTDMPRPLLVVTTHLQAHSEHDAIRVSQMDEALELLELLGFRDRTSIFAGDFNSKPDRASYEHWLDRTPYADAARSCLDRPASCTVDLGEGGATDENDVYKSTPDRHFYFGPATAGRYEVEPVFFGLRYTTLFDGTDRYSDHWGYEVHYRITWR